MHKLRFNLSSIFWLMTFLAVVSAIGRSAMLDEGYFDRSGPFHELVLWTMGLIIVAIVLMGFVACVYRLKELWQNTK